MKVAAAILGTVRHALNWKKLLLTYKVACTPLYKSILVSK